MGQKNQNILYGNTQVRVLMLLLCIYCWFYAQSYFLSSSLLSLILVKYNLLCTMYLQVALDSIGVSIWQMAAAPIISSLHHTKDDSLLIENGHANDKIGDDDDPETSESEDDRDLVELHGQPTSENRLVAFACDDGCVRIYSISDSDKLTYVKSLTRVSGEISAPFRQMTMVLFFLLQLLYAITFVLLPFQGAF